MHLGAWCDALRLTPPSKDGPGKVPSPSQPTEGRLSHGPGLAPSSPPLSMDELLLLDRRRQRRNGRDGGRPSVHRAERPEQTLPPLLSSAEADIHGDGIDRSLRVVRLFLCWEGRAGCRPARCKSEARCEPTPRFCSCAPPRGKRFIPFCTVIDIVSWSGVSQRALALEKNAQVAPGEGKTPSCTRSSAIFCVG